MYMKDTYKDKPIDIERWVETLSDKERELFDKGYLTALHGVLEMFVDTKQTLLEKVIVLNKDQDDLRKQLLSRVHILDVLEKGYERRVRNLESYAH